MKFVLGEAYVCVFVLNKTYSSGSYLNALETKAHCLCGWVARRNVIEQKQHWRHAQAWKTKSKPYAKYKVLLLKSEPFFLEIFYQISMHFSAKWKHLLQISQIYLLVLWSLRCYSENKMTNLEVS